MYRTFASIHISRAINASNLGAQPHLKGQFVLTEFGSSSDSGRLKKFTRSRSGFAP